MVKTKNPLLSLGARGLVGSISYLTRRKVKLAEKTPVVPDQQTPAQLSWRHMYQKCAVLWQALSVTEKAEWESLARPRHMTGFAYWQSQCLKPNPGIYLPLQGGTMQGAIDMDSYHIHGLPAPIHLQDPLRRQDYVDYIQPFLHAHGARVRHGAAQAIPNATWTTLAYSIQRYDTDNIHDVAISNSRLTCKTAGKYIIISQIDWELNAVGRRMLSLHFNGVADIARAEWGMGALNVWSGFIATIYDLSVGDFVETRVYQTSGAPLNIQVFISWTPEFMMQRIGT